jgi:hypothetical protein
MSKECRDPDMRIENQDEQGPRQPGDRNAGAQQEHDRGRAKPREPDVPGAGDGSDGRDLPPADADRDPDSPWLGGG